MCGIVGLYYKTAALEGQLGRMLAAMLVQMTDRGPDSAGVAVYRNPVAAGGVKITLQSAGASPTETGTGTETDWNRIGETIRAEIAADAVLAPLANHAVLSLTGDGDWGAGRAADWIEANLDGVNITSIGSAIEIYKEKGLPAEFITRFQLHDMSGSHALGHTRMATESAVTTEHSHPFSTGLDLCLVHNGSLSNHNRLREKLRAEGIRFYTDNDSEVAAGYLTWRLSQGATLVEAMQAALKDLDGFYTFAIGTRDGFAVMRDPIACKPAILAETDEWVAMSSEYRAIAQLPGSERATIWEPQPAKIYSWQHERAA